MNDSIFSIITDPELLIGVGNTTISGCPNLEAANSFIELAKLKNMDDSELMLDNDSDKVNLVGAVLIEDLLNKLNGCFE